MIIEHDFNGSMGDVFEALRQYERYPDYLTGVSSIVVLDHDPANHVKKVQYQINLVKKFHYTLNITEEHPNRISWHLEDSNIMKENTGSWQLEKRNEDHTHAKYQVDIKFHRLIPKSLTDKVIASTTGSLIDGFQRLITDYINGFED